MHNDAHFGVKGQRVGEGHRVGDGYELHVEGTDAAAFAVSNFNEGEVVRDARLGESVSGEAERQR